MKPVLVLVLALVLVLILAVLVALMLMLILAVLVLLLQILGRTLRRMPSWNHQIKSEWRPCSDGGPIWTRRRRRPPHRIQTSRVHLLGLGR